MAAEREGAVGMLEQPMKEVAKLHRLVEAKDRVLDSLR